MRPGSILEYQAKVGRGLSPPRPTVLAHAARTMRVRSKAPMPHPIVQTTEYALRATLAAAHRFEGLRRTYRVIGQLVPLMFEYKLLSWRHRKSSNEVSNRAFELFHSAHANIPLRICLELRGFYIKVGQLLSGQQLLPKAYRLPLTTLLDAVPPMAFDVIQKIVETELGIRLDDVFAEFCSVPIGAASIGQVHRARLHDGTPVVVKVQYPTVERNFKLDFDTIKTISKWTEPAFVPILDEVAKSFNDEFDFVKEAQHLRTMCTVVRPRFEGTVDFPQPYDEQHPNLPKCIAMMGGSLTAKHVLVMDFCPGESLSRVGKRMLSLCVGLYKCVDVIPPDVLTCSPRTTTPTCTAAGMPLQEASRWMRCKQS